MPPRNADVPFIFSDGDTDVKNEVEPVVTQETHEQKRPPLQLVWRNIFWISFLHLGALYGLYLTPWARSLTWLWTLCTYGASAMGITAGAHRLWSHKSYKAKLPLRVLLAAFNSMAFQNDIIEWSRDHRVHHKYSETDADPHNAKRGFFFSHVGWLLCRKHPEVKAKGKNIDVSDLKDDIVCRVQRKLYAPSVAFFCFLLPALVPWYYWGEDFWTAYWVCCVMRYVLVLNATWCVNSVAHFFGNKPYDQQINPVENIAVTLGAIGEGYHNYHHTFPQDYSTSEYGWKINVSTIFINFMACIGQAYDLRKMPDELVQRRKLRTGDGTASFGCLTPSNVNTAKQD